MRLPEPDAQARRLPASPGGHAPERAPATRLRPRAQRLRVTLRSGMLRVQFEQFGTKGGESRNCALTTLNPVPGSLKLKKKKVSDTRFLPTRQDLLTENVGEEC